MEREKAVIRAVVGKAGKEREREKRVGHGSRVCGAAMMVQVRFVAERVVGVRVAMGRVVARVVARTVALRVAVPRVAVVVVVVRVAGVRAAVPRVA